MKKRYIGTAFVLSMMMGLSMLGGCGSAATGTSTTTTAAVQDSQAGSQDQSGQEAEENVIYGVVESVSEDSISIQTGAMKEMTGGPGANGPMGGGPQNGTGSGDQGQPADGQAPTGEASESQDSSEVTDGQSSGEETTGQTNDQQVSQGNDQQAVQGNGQQGAQGNGQQAGPSASDFLDMTGETQELAVTADTVVEKTSRPAGGPGGNGQMGGGPGNGQAPSGDQQAPDANGPGNQEGTEAQTDDNQAVAETEAGQTATAADDQQAAQGDDQTGSQNDQSQANSNQNGPGNGQPGQGQKPEDETETASLSDISEGDLVKITLNEDGSASTITIMDLSFGGQGGPGGAGGQGGSGAPGGGQSSAPSSYTAVTTYSVNTETEAETYESTGTDENAVLVDSGATVSLTNPTISRKSSDSTGGDSASFYGVGAAALVTDGTAYIKGGTIDTDSAGGAGVFAYGDGTAYVADTIITTSQDTSGGIHVAGGGSLYAWDVTATTEGGSAAAIRSDRGGGTMVVDGGSYTSNGVGSPSVYCTADITVNNADLTANGSEAVCIEGFNSLRLFDTNLTGNMSDDEQNDNTWNVILYQSMSGDSEEGNSTFEMSGGSVTAKNGGMFYTTNTESTFILNNVDITYADENDYFLRCTGNSNQRGWGESGANGADCNFTAASQKMEGDVIWDSISQLDFYITDGSSLTGAVIDDETNAGSGGSGYCNLYITKDSSWTVTGDSSLTQLSNEGTILDSEGKTVTIKGSDGTVYVEGDSAYTVTVESYSDTADTSGASQGSSWSDYQVEKPASL